MPQVFRSARENPQRPTMLIFISPQLNRVVGLITAARLGASDASDAYAIDACYHVRCTTKRHTSSHFKEPTVDFVNSRRVLSRNRPNYKSTSTKTITEMIKFSHLSPYNSGSPMKSRGISNQPTYKPRSL
jgi:hypothetical protein